MKEDLSLKRCYVCDKPYKRLVGMHLKSHGMKIIDGRVYHHGMSVDD